MIFHSPSRCTESKAFSKSTKCAYSVACHSFTCSMMLRRMNIWSTVLLFFRNPACSFLRTLSTPFWILWMMTLPITLLATGNNVTPRQFLHSFRSPFLGIFTIKPFFHCSGILVPYPIKQSCQLLYCHITICFVQLRWNAIYTWCFSTLCLLQCLLYFCLPYLCCIHLANSSSFTSFSSTGFIGASLTSTSSKCSAHFSSLAFLSFIVSPLLFLIAAT